MTAETSASSTSAAATQDPITVPTLVVTPDPSTVTVTTTAPTSTSVDTTTVEPVTTSATDPEPTESATSNPETTEPATSTPEPPEPTTTEPKTTEPSTPPTTTTKTSPPKTTTPKPPKNNDGSMTKKVVVIDPGHNGDNAAHPEIINQLVDAGFGETKACNTTGTSTNDGYSEHQFNWQVANYVKGELEAKGITVIMTRDSDDGVGPCVDKRAAVGNQGGVDAVLSIHGDGADEGARGFYVMTAERDPAGPEIAEQSLNFAKDTRDALVANGLSPANYLGNDGLWKRSDLSGLNLSQVPTVMVEMGNMRDSADSALMTSESGQQQIAAGLADGVVQFLVSH